MRSRLGLLLFTIFAPITVPAYVLFLAASNLLGGAFYIVIEASVAKIARRPITLTPLQMGLLAVPVVAVAPIAALVHLAIWFVRMLGRALCQLGEWQTGLKSHTTRFAAGLLWALVAVWTTFTCLNAAAGLGLFGDPLKGREDFVEIMTRRRPLSSLPPEMQARRQAIIDDLNAYGEAMHPHWERLLTDLKDDQLYSAWLPETIGRRLTELPWFFVPSEFSDDGLDHSAMLLGPLVFVWMLLIRWPGTFIVLKRGLFRAGWLAVRLAASAWAIYAIATWVPWRAHRGFGFAMDDPGTFFRMFSPAWWMGIDPHNYAPPEWLVFNIGLWLILLGIIVAIWWTAWRVSPFVGWPRYYVAFLASRLLQRKRIAFFSVGAVTLCVAMMIIVISVMGGFVDSIRARAHGLLGDLVMDGDLQGFPFYDDFIARISELRDEKTGRPIVKQATPLIHSYGILQFPQTNKTKAVRIWGVKLDEYVRVNEFGKDLFYQNRFGGTSLGDVRQPVYGFDEKQTAVLPDDMDAKYAEYRANLPQDEREEETRRFAREPTQYFPGPGVIEMADVENDRINPGYKGKPYPGIIIGRDIIARRTASGEYRRHENYPRGEACYLTVLPLTRGGDVSPEPPPKPVFRYIDDSRTGIHEIDSMNVYVGFDVLQNLLDMGPQQRADSEGMTQPRCSQLQIKLNEPWADDRELLLQKKKLMLEVWTALRAEGRADGIEEMMMANVDIQTWEEMQHDYIAAIEKEKFLVLIMFGVISIVAVFLILCIFYMIVQEKTRDIGIIKSVGGSAEGVAAVFLAYGGAIGLVGCILGTLLGTTFVEHINDVQDWLARLNPDWRVWSPETYSFDKIPDVWKWAEVIWISLLAIAASIAGATFPALRASRTWPVESLRYE